MLHEAGTVSFGKHVTLTSPVQVAADLDVRKLLDLLRVAIEERLSREEAPGAIGQKTDRETDAKAGREAYRWRTMRDERVRPEHRVREGRVFRWDADPPDGAPGIPFGCRCYAEVYDDRARRKSYRITAVVGSATAAGCEIRLVPHFIDAARWEIISREVIPPVVARWWAMAVPSSGDGVGTEANPNLGPRN